MTGELSMSKSIGSLLVAFLGVTAVAVPPRADLFSFTASIQTYTVATTGVYTITSAGAQGGPGFVGDSGGLGAVVTGDVSLTAGTVLDIVVGQEGFEPDPYAGAGGGGGWADQNGSDALPGTSGGNGQGTDGGAGGTSGGGGFGSLGYDDGGRGAGWSGNGGESVGDDGGGQTGPSWLGGAGDRAGDGGGNNGGGGGGDGGGSLGGGGGGSYIDPSFFRWDHLHRDHPNRGRFRYHYAGFFRGSRTRLCAPARLGRPRHRLRAPPKSAHTLSNEWETQHVQNQPAIFNCVPWTTCSSAAFVSS
jgi:hypothetical protein